MIVTGTSKSRLSELKKYSKYNNIFDNYIQSGIPNTNGLNKGLSTENKIIYYIDNIIYVDTKVNNNITTTFSFERNNIDLNDYVNKPIYKDFSKENIISNPKYDSDVFITRQQISAFEKNYALSFVEKLNDITTYASGNYFYIVKNT